MVNGTLCPAGIVTGSDSPLIVNAELLILVAETVTLAPLADRLPEPVPVPPLTTLPMASVDGEILSCPTAAVPVPVSVAVDVDGWPLLVTVSVALADPTAVGLNVIVKGTLCPSGMVTGRVSPLILNAELLILAAVTVTLAPLAVRFPLAVPLAPSTTLPTAIVEGETLSCPAAAVPIPVNETDIVEFEAFEETVTVPLALPEAAGENMTLNGALCPAASVKGTVIPLRVKPVPLIPISETVTLEPPLFVTVPDRFWFLPTVTLPKLRLFGLAPRVPGEFGWMLTSLMPWQPFNRARLAITNKLAAKLALNFEQSFSTQFAISLKLGALCERHRDLTATSVVLQPVFNQISLVHVANGPKSQDETF
jgi:hypothetical protein